MSGAVCRHAAAAAAGGAVQAEHGAAANCCCMRHAAESGGLVETLQIATHVAAALQGGPVALAG